MPHATAYILVACAVALNVPFGMWRATVRRLSWRWLAAIHAPISLLFLLRTTLGLSSWYIVVSLTGALAGQLLGSWLMDRLRSPHAAPVPVPVSGEAGEALSRESL